MNYMENLSVPNNEKKYFCLQDSTPHNANKWLLRRFCIDCASNDRTKKFHLYSSHLPYPRPALKCNALR